MEGVFIYLCFKCLRCNMFGNRKLNCITKLKQYRMILIKSWKKYNLNIFDPIRILFHFFTKGWNKIIRFWYKCTKNVFLKEQYSSCQNKSRRFRESSRLKNRFGIYFKLDYVVQRNHTRCVIWFMLTKTKV